MSVGLRELYDRINPEYKIRLCTRSCFGKIVEWTHIVEKPEFIKMLHGNELIFNTGIHYSSEAWLAAYIRELNGAGASGLVIALEEGRSFSKEVIEMCDKIRFPLFSAEADTPYMDVMRLFAEILLSNKQRETSLAGAFKNAVRYPEQKGNYREQFHENGLYDGMGYTVAVAGGKFQEMERTDVMERLRQLDRALYYSVKQEAAYEEAGRMILLVAGEQEAYVRQIFERLCVKYPDIYVGIGTYKERLVDICKSYQCAMTAYRLLGGAIPRHLVSYEEIGVFKLLADINNREVRETFIRETMGALMEYDRSKKAEYVPLLKVYFENECSILETSKALYCHKNTVSYKLEKIRSVLGYDILKNENRVRIMLAFYLLKISENGGDDLGK